MQTLPYREQSVSTLNAKLAAALMLFGFRLKRNNPFTWDNEFDSKELCMRSRKDKSIKPREKVTWNLEPSNTSPNEIFAAFAGKESDVNFEAKVDELVSEPHARAQIKAAHSAAIAQAAREVLDHREHLSKVYNQIPDDAKWVL